MLPPSRILQVLSSKKIKYNKNIKTKYVRLAITKLQIIAFISIYRNWNDKAIK